ncbi:MAG: hypothetical protein AAFQ87_10295 [Bacteroidota bacterium]
MKPYLSFLLLFAFCLPQLKAQDNIRLKNRPFQVSLIYPLSTNGPKAYKYTNNLSFNMIAGYNGGLNGIEMGGFLNVIKHNANGIQMSGFANAVGKNVNGIQMAGFSNTVRKNVHGIQMAGFANAAGKNVKGLQFGGFANVAGKSVRGGQFSGFINLAGKDMRGVQAAGFANVASGHVRGLQLSGFLNVAKKLSGLQIGVVNYVDELEKGAPIGLISIVRKGGVRAISLSRSDMFNYEVSARLGAPAFYNIISYGWAPVENANNAWALGYGLGAMTNPDKSLGIQVEAISYQLFEDGTWNVEDLNMLNRLSGNLQLRLLGGLSLYGGVSMNALISQRTDREGQIGSDLLPEELYQDGMLDQDTRLSVFPGFQFGVMLEL